MNKSELIDSMAQKSGLTKKDSEKALDAFINSVSESLSSSDDVNIPNFGSFKAKERAARKGRNLQTGEEITIAARTVATFTPGKALKEKVNS